MATSSSTNYKQTASSIIKDALLLLGVVYEDETVNESTNNTCLRALNRMIKHWQNYDVQLHTQKEGVIIFDNDTIKYTFADGSLSGSSVGVVNADVLVQTTFGADEAAAQTILTVTSSTGMTAGDKVIIELDSGDRDETTIATVDNATQITVNDALASAAASGNYIYTYPAAVTHANLIHPRRIDNVRLRNADGNEREITMYSREDYDMINDKDLEASPSAVFFDRQLNNPTISVWPEPDSLRETLRFSYTRALEDLDAFTNDVDFPPEYLDALVYNLAVRVGPIFGKDAKLQILGPLAAMTLQLALEGDQDQIGLQLYPDVGY